MQFFKFYFCVFITGKTFLNSIEYLDEKTDEWTTFSPKNRQVEVEQNHNVSGVHNDTKVNISGESATEETNGKCADTLAESLSKFIFPDNRHSEEASS